MDKCNMNCIICGKYCEETRQLLHDDDWKIFQETALKWKGLDRFGELYDSVQWETGQSDKVWHRDCKRDISGKRKIEQAIARKRKWGETQTEGEEQGHNKDIELPKESRATRSSTGLVHKKDLCIWCMHGDDTRYRATRGKFYKISEIKSWLKFKASAMHLTDSNMRIRIQKFIDATTDPFATEVWYHDNCRKKYVRPTYGNSEKNSDLQNVNEKEVEQRFLSYISEAIFEEKEPKTLKSLCKWYQDMLLNFGYYKLVKSDRMKELLLLHFGEKIGFHQRMQKNKSEIVYSTENNSNYYEAVINGSEITDEELFLIAAKRMRENIRSKFNAMAWPPTVNELCLQKEPDPTISTFLLQLSNIKRNSSSDSKIIFLSECIQSLVTKEKSRMRTTYSVTLHGLTRSKEIVQLAHDLGIGISYKNVLGLHDSWALRELQENNVCPGEIATKRPGTVIIDNDDFKDDDLTGGSTSHRTNMMFVQPIKWIEVDNDDTHVLQNDARKKLKELVPKEIEIHPYKTKVRGEPCDFKPVDVSPGSTSCIQKKLVTHALARLGNDHDSISANEQSIGAFTGFMASISPKQSQSKPYYFMTLPKPPSKAVVYTLMEKAEAAARLKEMPFIQMVGDQPVYAFIVELKNENSEEFVHILPVLGDFHTQMSFMGAIYKRIRDSNVEDLLVESGLIAEGSVDKALKGGHYNRATRIYKLFYETLLRLLINHGEEKGLLLPDAITSLLDTIRDTEITPDDRYFAFQTLQFCEEFDSYIDRLFDTNQPENHMAMYILSVMNMIEILFMNIDSLRTNNWEAFLSSLRLMMPWMIIYDQTNYGRWLPVFWLEMATLQDDHAEWIKDIFSQSMTGNSYSSQPPDIWIECTMNKGSKMKAGWKRLLKNEIGLNVHVKNANNISTVRHFLQNLIYAIKTKVIHKENVRSRLRVDEQVVQDMLSLIDEWQCDPFNLENQSLRKLQSGEYARDELVRDLESAYSDGEMQTLAYINERLYSTATSIFETLKRNGRITFATPPLTSKDSKKENSEMEAKALIRMLELVTQEDQGILKMAFEYRITEHCLPIFNGNGTIRKCQKSKIVEMMELVETAMDKYIAIVDMGLAWRLATPTADERDKPDNTLFTWKDFAIKVFNVIKSRHQRASTIVAVNDYYGDDVINTKDGEHQKRSKYSSCVQIKNVYPSIYKRFPSIKEFQNFFKNPSNKRRLQLFLKEQFALLCKKEQKRFIYSLKDECTEMTAQPFHDSVDHLQCSHLEADTAMLYIYSQIRKQDDSIPVMIDSEDADVVVLCAYASLIIPGPLAIKRKKAIFDCHQLCSAEMKNVIVPLHIVTGCDTISSFFGVGKKSVWKRVEKDKEAQLLLSNLSVDNIEVFVIEFIYNDKSSTTLGEMRYKKWRKMKTKKPKSLARIGPDKDSNYHRSKRVIYQCNVMLNFQEPDAPSNPLDQGYTISNGCCMPRMYEKPALPEQLANIYNSTTECTANVDSESEESACDEDEEIEDGLDI